MLSVEGVSVRVKNKILLQDISVAFLPGKFNLIIGPNGSGKSTLIKSLSGILKPADGKILYSGRDVRAIPLSELAQIRAMLSQHTELAFSLKVSDIVMMGRYARFKNQQGPADKRIVAEVMEFTGVSAMSDRNYFTLSGGEQQRVQFARVLAQVWSSEPDSGRYLFLDEPLTFLDIYYQYDFMNIICELIRRDNITVVGVIHDLNMAARYADMLVLLYQGRILAAGDAQEVLTSDNIRAAYGISPRVNNTQDGIHLMF